MKSIAFVIPYFGKLPDKSFELWLLSCKNNPSIDWLIFTDDSTKYDYPDNVKVTYCSFDDIRKKVQRLFDFQIVLDRPYKLCDFKAAYGEIFEKELEKYDYWGMCDLDLVWGNIRKFLTDDILEKYERIGNQGHCSIFKNTEEVNKRYRTIIHNKLNYRIAFSSERSYCFDESGLDDIYQGAKIDYYSEVIFAHLRKYDAGFFLDLKPESENFKNKRQVFLWENGSINRYYLNQGKVCTEEYMYCHFWCRPMSYKTRIDKNDNNRFLIYSDVVKNYNGQISKSIVNKYGRKKPIVFFVKSIYKNRKKIGFKKILFNVKGMKNHLLKK